MYVHIVEVKSARGHNREDDNRARIPKKMYKTTEET